MKVTDCLDRNNNNIDLIRLITALLVVWTHAFALVGLQNEPISDFLKIIGSGRLGVCMFFFLSGLLVTNSLIRKKSVCSYVCSRIFRIVPLFITVVIICTFIIGPIFTELSVGRYFKEVSTWKYLLDNIVFRINYNLPFVWDNLSHSAINGSLWTIPIEIGCYIYLLIFYIFHRNFGVPKHWMILVLSGLVLIPHSILCDFLGIQYSQVESVFVFSFIIGSCLAIYQDKIELNVRLIIGLLLLIALTWRYQNIICYVFPISVSIILLYISSISPIVGWHLKHDISYGVYLWHWPIIQILVSMTGLTNPYVVFLIGCAFTILVSIVSAVYIEEPMIKVGRNIVGWYKGRQFKFMNNGIFVLVLLFLVIVLTKMFL